MNLLRNPHMPLHAAAAMILLPLLSMASCQQEARPEEWRQDIQIVAGDSFHATIEEGALSKTAIGESGESSCTMVWSEDDRVSAFMQNTSRWQYVIGPEAAGSTSAEFMRVQDETSSTGTPLAHNVIWYPYGEDVECTAAETAYELSVVLPQVQAYAENSFGKGAFPMVAVDEDRNVSFKNVCGGIKLQLKGTVKVASIEVEGKDSEPLSGAAAVTAYADGTNPEVVMASGASSSVILNCDGVWLNPDTATEFIMILPPVTFTNGFDVTITDMDGHKYVLTAKNGSVISRSSLLVMPEIVVDDHKTIRILAIGNSFSVDAMAYLYGILDNLGYRKIVLGDLYEAGCLVEEHASWFASNSAKYTYYHNVTGGYDASKSDSSEKYGWTRTTAFAPMEALTETDWDFITMQQGSKYSGMADTYSPYLSNLIQTVRNKCPDAELVWHMTWAYQGDSDHSAFPNYGSDQMTMYNAIVNATRTQVLTLAEIDRVIPNGTAVQNMRTSFVGDNLTRDGYHLSLREGRFLAALTYAKILTGCDLADISYTPEQFEYDDLLVAAIKDAVDKACENPFEVTVSAYSLDAYPELTPFTNESFESVSSGYKSGDWQ